MSVLVIFMTSSLTKRFMMSLTLSNKGNKKIRCYPICGNIYMETNFDLRKPRHSEQILPVPSIIQFVQIQTSFSLLFRLFLLEPEEIRDFFLSSVITKKWLYSHLFIESFIQNKNRSVVLHNLARKRFVYFTTQQGKVFYTLQLFNSIISKDFHFLYNMACPKKLIQ